jgi:hypothetical protein
LEFQTAIQSSSSIIELTVNIKKDLTNYNKYEGVFYFDTNVVVVDFVALHTGILSLAYPNENSIVFTYDGADITSSSYDEGFLKIKVSQKNNSETTVQNSDWSIHFTLLRRSDLYENYNITLPTYDTNAFESIADELLSDFDPHTNRSDVQYTLSYNTKQIRDSSTGVIYSIIDKPEYSPTVFFNGYAYIQTNDGGFRDTFFGTRKDIFGVYNGNEQDPLMYAAQYAIFRTTSKSDEISNSVVISHGHSAVNRGNPLSISRMKGFNVIHTNCGMRQGTGRSPSFGVYLNYNSANDTYVCSTAIKRIGVKKYNVIVRLYSVDVSTQEIDFSTLKTVTYNENNFQATLNLDYDKILYIGCDRSNSKADYLILRTKYYKCHPTMFHNIESMDQNMVSMLNEYKIPYSDVVNKITLTPPRLINYIQILNHDINNPLSFSDKSNSQLNRTFSMGDEAIIGSVVSLNTINNIPCFDTSNNFLTYPIIGSMLPEDFSGIVIFEAMVNHTANYTFLHIKNTSGDSVFQLMMKSGYITIQIESSEYIFDNSLITNTEQTSPLFFSFVISNFKVGTNNKFNVVLNLKNILGEVITEQTEQISNNNKSFDYDFTTCQIGNSGDNVKIGTVKLFNQMMYQKQMEELINIEFLKYTSTNPYLNTVDYVEVDFRHPDVINNNSKLTNVSDNLTDLSNSYVLNTYNDIKSSTINGHQSGIFETGFLYKNLGSGFTLWASQSALPVLNTICVYEITSDTMNYGDGCLCCHGISGGDKNFISGYRLNTTNYINAVYNNNDTVAGDLTQMSGFAIGKYILISTLQKLSSDNDRAVMFQFLYNIDGTFIQDSSITLNASLYDSDFSGGFFIGTQKSINSDMSYYNIGYIKYCSGTITSNDRTSIVSSLSNSWVTG